jgi:hypothetical protein
VEWPRDQEVDIAIVVFLGQLCRYDNMREDGAQSRSGLELDFGVDVCRDARAVEISECVTTHFGVVVVALDSKKFDMGSGGLNTVRLSMKK